MRINYISPERLLITDEITRITVKERELISVYDRNDKDKPVLTSYDFPELTDPRRMYLYLFSAMAHNQKFLILESSDNFENAIERAEEFRKAKSV